jgi:hypothetical protein
MVMKIVSQKRSREERGEEEKKRGREEEGRGREGERERERVSECISSPKHEKDYQNREKCLLTE